MAVGNRISDRDVVRITYTRGLYHPRQVWLVGGGIYRPISIVCRRQGRKRDQHFEDQRPDVRTTSAPIRKKIFSVGTK